MYTTNSVHFIVLSSKRHSWPAIAKPHPTLQGMPPEILNEIFNLLLTGHWEGKTHPFLIALRADQKLYKLALGAYNEVNVFTLSPKNQWISHLSDAYYDISRIPFGLIRNLIVEVPLILRKYVPSLYRTV